MALLFQAQFTIFCINLGYFLYRNIKIIVQLSAKVKLNLHNF